jgi:competence protein ComEC
MGRFRAWGAGLFVITCVASAATLPITAAVFHRISWAGMVTNLFFVPLVGFWIVPTGMAGVLLFSIDPALGVFGARAAGTGAALLAKGVHFFSAIKGSGLWVIPPGGALIAVYYLLFGAWVLRDQARDCRRWAGLLLLSVLFVALTGAKGALKGDGQMHVFFLDVGQGSSTLLVLPGGKTVLVDGGGRYGSGIDTGKSVILPALLTLGIRRLDAMVLTHPHPDHLSGLIGVLEEFPVGEVWDEWERYPSEAYARFRESLQDKGVPRRSIRGAGGPVWIDSVRFEALSGGPGGAHRSNSEVNNASLVLKATFGKVSLLVPGDLEQEGEMRLVRTCPEKLKSTLLLVPHHGSFSSSHSTFLHAVQPLCAVIPVGFQNPFGLPSSTVLGRYQYISPEKALFRTDRDGCIQIRTDGTGIWVRQRKSWLYLGEEHRAD